MRLAIIAIAWLAYFALHSLFAATVVKAWVAHHWPHLIPGYRAAFNLIAILALLPMLWLVYAYANPGDWLWRWQGALAWLANGLALAALLCFFASTRAYDMGEFLGLRQLKDQGSDDNQTFTLSFFHRYVRHPWYCFGLVLIWTRDMNQPQLVSAVAITLYFIVGSRLEERKLVARYGEKYRRYMARVPGLVPVPWRHISARDVDTLVNSPDAH